MISCWTVKEWLLAKGNERYKKINHDYWFSVQCKINLALNPPISHCNKKVSKKEEKDGKQSLYRTAGDSLMKKFFCTEISELL